MMDVGAYLLSVEDRPDWVIYPPELVELVASGRVDLRPWYVATVKTAKILSAGFKSRVGRDLLVFAYRQDREDRACLEKGRGEAIVIVHDNTTPGWENVETFPNFRAWLDDAEYEASYYDNPMPQW